MSPRPFPSDATPGIRQGSRLVAKATMIVLGLALVRIAPPWIGALVPGRYSGAIAAGFLSFLRLAHAAGLVAGPIAGVGMGLILQGARRRGRRRPWVARGLLACVSGLIGLTLAEALGAFWWYGDHGLPPNVPTARSRVDVAAGLPQRFPEATPAGEVNLVVIGGSSARGVPFARWTSVGQIVAWQLGRLIPQRRIHLQVLARDGQRLDDQHRKLASLRRRPDALIVYSGHNEFQSRFTWDREADPYLDQPARPARRLASWPGDDLPLGRVILEALARHRLAIPPPEQFARQLVDVPCCTRGESAAILADFRRRLEAIVVDCERVGTLPILVIPPSNLADFEPNRSVLPRATPRADRESFAAAFAVARHLEETDPAAARRQYHGLLNQQPGFAEAHYRLAVLLRRAGDRPGAERHFILARDLDGQPTRCSSTFVQVYRAVAARHPRTLLIDGPAYFRAWGPLGLLDDHLFADGFHPSFLGNLLLARAILDGLRVRRSLGWPTGATATVTVEECAAHFGLDAVAWRSVCDWSARFYRSSAYLRYDPEGRLAKSRLYAAATRRIAAGEPPEAVGIPGVGVMPSP